MLSVYCCVSQTKVKVTYCGWQYQLAYVTSAQGHILTPQEINVTLLIYLSLPHLSLPSLALDIFDD